MVGKLWSKGEGFDDVEEYDLMGELLVLCCTMDMGVLDVCSREYEIFLY